MTRRVLVGEVVRSGKMQKTVSVKVERFSAHRDYGKRVRRSAIYHVHDEDGVAKLGQIWAIQESPRLSKLKHWKLLEQRSAV